MHEMEVVGKWSWLMWEQRYYIYTLDEQWVSFCTRTNVRTAAMLDYLVQPQHSTCDDCLLSVAHKSLLISFHFITYSHSDELQWSSEARRSRRRDAEKVQSCLTIEVVTVTAPSIVAEPSNPTWRPFGRALEASYYSTVTTSMVQTKDIISIH